MLRQPCIIFNRLCRCEKYTKTGKLKHKYGQLSSSDGSDSDMLTIFLQSVIAFNIIFQLRSTFCTNSLLHFYIYTVSTQYTLCMFT